METLARPRPLARISELNIFPIKSCAGVKLESIEVGMRGLQFDRRYALMEAPDDASSNRKGGIIVTIRQQPKLVTVKPKLVRDEVGAVEVEAEGMPSILIKEDMF